MLGPPGVMPRQKHRQRGEGEAHAVPERFLENQVVIAFVHNWNRHTLSIEPKTQASAMTAQIGKWADTAANATCEPAQNAAAQYRAGRMAEQLAHFRMGPQNGPGPVAVPHRLRLFVVGHPVENIDLEPRKHRRCTSQHSNVELRTKPFRRFCRRGDSHSDTQNREIGKDGPITHES